MAAIDTRRRLGPDQRRTQLVAAGLRLAKSGPIDEVTAPTLAREAGVSKALVFHYFPSQRELRAAIARSAADELLAVFATTAEGDAPEARLEAGLEAFISYIELQPMSYAAVARGAGSDELLREVFEDTRRAVVDIICGAIGIETPTARLRLVLRGWIAMVEETALEWAQSRAVPRTELVGFLRTAAFSFLAFALAPGGTASTAGAVER